MLTEQRKLILAALTLVLPLVMTGCPGTLEDKDRFLVDAAATNDAGTGEDGASEGGAISGGCGDVVTHIFQPQCGNSGCHGAIAPQQGLDLVSAGVAARVVGVAGTECTGRLADPTRPETSLLYTNLAARPAGGAQMPLAQPPLSSADAACVLAWIAAQ